MLLENLAKAIAPVISHMAEEIWSQIPYARPTVSVFAGGWMNLSEAWRDPVLGSTWTSLRQVRLEVNRALEQARVDKLIGASTEAKVILGVGDPELLRILREYEGELRYLFITSQVELQSVASGLTVTVLKAEGEKCVRCWNYSLLVGHASEHPELCERCGEALAGNF